MSWVAHKQVKRIKEFIYLINLGSGKTLAYLLPIVNNLMKEGPNFGCNFAYHFNL